MVLRVGLLLLALVLFGCNEATAPTVRCEGALVVHITVTRFGTDTAVVCSFPVDSTPPVPPPDTTEHHDHHRHHHDHGERT